ncbi:DUF7309 domain-containing protein [Fusibacter ferrireducens]|uniref:Core-binding (CB) domain-containing protein n=1 Tax=Fusibacter ferrireducens TaxID=2785058 RepID=A0ABR9ZW37_9FIRM|nr:hypothetical protein [Fusibacter ferrireducens]MBF4694655.1 hypothetical protein [Fusibacter ferrireducens]
MVKKLNGILKENEKYLIEFEKALIASQLSEKTVEKHVGNAAFYINEFLNYEKPTPTSQGMSKIDEFFSEWFVEKFIWVSKTAYNDSMTSLKKFYKFLLDSQVVDKTAYDQFVSEIKNNKSKWIKIVENINYADDFIDYFNSDRLGDLDDPLGIVDDHDYFFNAGMLDEDECDALLNEFYTKAAVVYKEKPWLYLAETDIIELSLPITDEIYYASVIGSGNMSRGIIFYQGARGLQNAFKMLGESNEDIHQIAASQSYIALHFDQDDQLDEIDRAFITRSGVSFKSSKELPYLRVQDPGMLACPLEVIELIDLTELLNAALSTFRYLKKNKQLRDWFDKDQIFAMTISEKGKVNYEFKQIEAILNHSIDIASYYDELSLRKLKKKAKLSKAHWEVEQFYLPSPIFEEDSAYLAHFPSVLVIVDRESEQVVGHYISEPMASEMEFQTYFYELLMTQGKKPQKVLFRNQEVIQSIFPILLELEIEIEYDEQLLLASEFVDGMVNQILGSGPN